MLLRPGWAEDAPALARALRGEARSPNAWSDALADAEAFLAAPDDPTLPRFLVTLRTAGAPLVIGTCGLTRSAAGHVDLHCWIDEQHRGLGFAAEARRALSDIAMTLGQHPLEVQLAA
ncbi:MAG: GNAT family N-acetyltransferase [Sphingomicrobium sp.]